MDIVEGGGGGTVKPSACPAFVRINRPNTLIVAKVFNRLV